LHLGLDIKGFVFPEPLHLLETDAEMILCCQIIDNEQLISSDHVARGMTIEEFSTTSSCEPRVNLSMILAIEHIPAGQSLLAVIIVYSIRSIISRILIWQKEK
jgi:hypothetical protein